MHRQRMYPRIEVKVPVLCELSDGRQFAGMIVDVAIGGCRIECDRAPSFGAELAMQARLPGSPELSRGMGVVRWSNDGAFGASVGLLDTAETARIAELANDRARSAVVKVAHPALR